MLRLLHFFLSSKFSFLLLSYFLVVGCKNKVETDTAYFGGQIINPKSDKIYFYKNEELIDSAKLNNNRFLIQLKKFTHGLYTFKHGNEFQYVYMQPSDSLLIRLKGGLYIQTKTWLFLHQNMNKHYT